MEPLPVFGVTAARTGSDDGVRSNAARWSGGAGRAFAAMDMNNSDLYVFRGRRGDLIKILWHDGLGISLYAKRLEQGRFSWPSTVGGAVSISAAQLGYLLEGIEWRNPVRTWRPSRAG